MDADQIAQEVAERVRALIGEAEDRAAAIVGEAEQEAKRIRERAEVEAQHRLGAARDAFEELQAKLGIGAEVPGGPVPVPEPAPPSVPEPTPPPPDPEPSPDPAPEPQPPLVPEPTPPPDEGTPPRISTEPAAANGVTPPTGKSGDSAGARLVAMNMALDGASREQIAAHLAENYELGDAGSVLDDVLALVAE